MILSLPFSLPDATPIGDQHAMQTRAGITYYFYNLEPYDCHPAGDRRAMLLRAAKLQVVSGVRQRDLMRAFQVSRPTVARAVRRYREHGEDAFYGPLRRRGRTVVDAQMADQAAKLLASGMSGNACARHLGIAATTFKANRRAGVIVEPARTHTGSVDAPQTHQAPVADHAPSVDAPQTHQAPVADHAPSVDAPQTHQAPSADHAPSVDAPQTHQAPSADHAPSVDVPQFRRHIRLRPPITPPAWTFRRHIKLRPPITPPAWTLRRHTKLRPPIAPPATPATSTRPWAARRATSRAARSPAPAC